MKSILICTIVRNQEANLPNWYSKLNRLAELCPDWSFTVSVYENDSLDATVALLRKFEAISRPEDSPLGVSPALNGRIFIKSENIGTDQYPSIWFLQRIKNLAACRNKCLEGFDLRTFDKIAYIEPDVDYNPDWCKELILAEHPKKIGFTPDIYSGWSLRTKNDPKESTFLYDTSATRQGPDEVSWDFAYANEYSDISLMKSHITDIDSNCVHTAWSTFSCFCVYNAEPFVKGLRWSHINKRLDTGRIKQEGGWADIDTAVICEDFRAMGYEKICYNTNCLIQHF